MHSDIYAFPINYHIRGGSLEIYLHCITFFVSEKWFVPHNEILRPMYNIGTDDHLLFTKYLSSELQECLGKLILPLEFIPFHHIFILVCNEYILWIHYIWVWYSNTLLLFLFSAFIFPHTSPMIWLMCSCHLNRAFFLSLITSYPLYMFFNVGIFVELHVIRGLPLSLVGWTLDGIFIAPNFSCRFYWK